jgi:nitroreductase
VTRRGEAGFDRLAAVLTPGNQAWAAAASALLLVAAETADEQGRPRRYALYDTGQAVAHLTTQAQAEGLSTHQMGGFDVAATATAFGLDDRLTPVVVVAVGRWDGGAALREQLTAREVAPRRRRPLSELVLPTPGELPLSA